MYYSSEILFLLGRVLFGGYFLISGINHFKDVKMLTKYAASKKVLFPKFNVILSGLMLFLGGLGVVLGMYIGLASTLLWIFLLVASFKMHDFWNVSDPSERMAQKMSFMKNMALLGASLLILWIPMPWVWGFGL